MNDDDDLSIRITSTLSLSLSKQCRKYRKYQCPTMEIPQFRPVRRMTRVFPYTHTKAKHRVWNVGNHKNLFTYQKKKKKECFVASDEIPLTLYSYYEEGERRVERKKNSPRAARIYIYAQKSAERIDLKITPKRPLAIGLRGPPDAWRSRFARGEGKREKEGVSLGTTAEFIPQKRGAGRAARSAARGRNRENSTLTAG